MKIGLLTRFLALGDDNDSGLGQHFRLLADALAKQNHTVHVIYLTPEPSLARTRLLQLVPAWSWEIIDVQPPSLLYRPFRLNWANFSLLSHLWGAWCAYRAFSRHSQFPPLEIIETHSYNLPALLLLRRRHRPKIVTRVATTMSQMVEISTVSSRAMRWEATLERQAIHLSDAVVTHTCQHRDIVSSQDQFEPARFKIVPLGVADPGNRSALQSDFDQKYVEFLFVGRFETRKGIDVLLAAIPTVASAFPNTRFTLAGSRGDHVEWNAFVTRHPELAGSRVNSLGRVSATELTALYQRCSVFVAPSRYESFGLIFTEAMSYAKPVIGCAAGGMPEVITPEITGLLAEPGDVASLTNCMLRLAENENLRQRMGEAARADFLSRFSSAQLARASTALYRNILEN